ncbi:MAG: hypothetical protein IPL94_03660 [Tetrasphaera sp.]|nr:hypothetical protein [Tetrasphaera sp.]
MNLRRDEAGSLSVLTLSLVMIAIVLILGGGGVTSALVARMRLIDAADGAALSAANALADTAYTQGVGKEVPLSNGGVVAAARDYLATRPVPQDILTWTLEPQTGTPDGRTAVVAMSATVQIPLLSQVLDAFGGSVTVSVVSRARAVVR